MTLEKNLLAEILKKLENIELLLKIGNRDKLKEFRTEIQKDNILNRILELSDGSYNYSKLAKKVAQIENVAEITVKKKISYLKSNGVITTRREGNVVFYENSGLFD